MLAVVTILCFVLILPAWKEVSPGIQYLWEMARHTAPYVVNTSGSVPWSAAGGYLKTILTSQPLAIPAAICALVLVIARDGMFRALSVAFLLQWILVLKQPTDAYLVPSLALGGLLMARTLSFTKWPFRWAGSVAVLSISVVSAVGQWRSFEAETAARLAMHGEVKRLEPKTEVIPCAFASSPHFALHKGDFQTGLRFADSLQSYFPNSHFCDFSMKQFGKFGSWREFVSTEQLFGSREELFLLGPPREERQIASLWGLDAEAVRTNAHETLYRVNKPGTR
jgi:hypothetical protein